MKLSKSIIKKYGISKKAWSMQRALKSSGRHKPKVKYMAKRRKSRAYTRKAKRVSHKRSSGLFGGLGKMLGAGIYGAGREYLSNAVAPITAKVPLGEISDEVVMIGALTLGKKFLGRRVPMVNDVANAGIIIESARIGASLASGGFNLGNGAQSGGMKVIG